MIFKNSSKAFENVAFPKSSSSVVYKQKLNFTRTIEIIDQLISLVISINISNTKDCVINRLYHTY